MSILLKLIKISPSTLTAASFVCLPHRAIRTTPTLLWLNQKLSRFGQSKKKEQQYMEKDGMPASSQLIYRAPMESYVAWTMHVSTVSASLIAAAALYNYTTNQPVLDSVEHGLVIHSEDIYYFALGFLAINTIMRLVVSMFPLRIYKDSGKYISVFHSQLPGGVSGHRFNQGEVKEVHYTLSPWYNSTYKLGTKTTILFEDYFKTPSEFHEMAKKRE